METLCHLGERLVASEDMHACGCRSGATRQCGSRVERVRCCGFRLDHVLLQHHERDDDEAVELVGGSAHSSGNATAATATPVAHGAGQRSKANACGPSGTGSGAYGSA